MPTSVKTSFLLWSTSVVLLLLQTACSNSTSPGVLPELEDGMFVAVTDENRQLEGEATFEITTPVNEHYPDLEYDPSLFLNLAIGKIELPDINNDRTPHRDDFEIWSGIFLSSAWDEASEIFMFDMEASMFRQQFIDPATFGLYDISRERSSVEIREFSDGLLTGTFTLTAISSNGSEVELEGEFRALASGDEEE